MTEFETAWESLTEAAGCLMEWLIRWKLALRTKILVELDSDLGWSLAMRSENESTWLSVFVTG